MDFGCLLACCEGHRPTRIKICFKLKLNDPITNGDGHQNRLPERTQTHIQSHSQKIIAESGVSSRDKGNWRMAKI